MRIVSAIVGSVLVWAAPIILTAAEPGAPIARISRRDDWKNVFGDQQVKLQLSVDAERAVKGRLVWNLTSAEGIPLQRGEVSSAGAEPLELELNIPSVKPGVIMPTRFTAQLLLEGEREPAAVYESVVNIFPPDPFHDRRERLKGLPIKLYDPSGATAKVFAAADLPHERITNAATIGDLDKGVLILGEGISFRTERALWDRALEAASHGVAILCLAPAGGEIELPAPGGAPGKLVDLSLVRSGYVPRIDKRLDERYWMSTPAEPKFSFVTGGRGPGITVDVQAGTDGWQWIGMQFAPVAARDKSTSTTPSHGVVIALPLIEHWEAGPTPRFLLAHLIDYLTSTPASTGTIKELATP